MRQILPCFIKATCPKELALFFPLLSSPLYRLSLLIKFCACIRVLWKILISTVRNLEEFGQHREGCSGCRDRLQGFRSPRRPAWDGAPRYGKGELKGSKRQRESKMEKRGDRRSRWNLEGARSRKPKKRGRRRGGVRELQG